MLSSSVSFRSTCSRRRWTQCKGPRTCWPLPCQMQALSWPWFTNVEAEKRSKAHSLSRYRGSRLNIAEPGRSARCDASFLASRGRLVLLPATLARSQPQDEAPKHQHDPGSSFSKICKLTIDGSLLDDVSGTGSFRSQLKCGLSVAVAFSLCLPSVLVTAAM